MLSEDTDFIKTNFFIHLAINFKKILSFSKQDLKILRAFDLKVKLKMLALFLSPKDNTEYIYVKPTSNMQTPYAILSKWAGLH